MLMCVRYIHHYSHNEGYEFVIIIDMFSCYVQYMYMCSVIICFLADQHS